MTNNKTVIADDLDDFAPEDVRPEPAKKSEPQWSGRKTKIRLQFPVLRGNVDSPAGRFIDSTTACIDCSEPTNQHQFHANASRVDGRWIGPEGDHIQTLQGGGWLAGTAEATERAQRQRRRDEQVGPEASLVLSATDLERLWKFELKGGRVDTEIESSMRREEAEQLRRAVQSGLGDLAETIRELVAEKSK